MFLGCIGAFIALFVVNFIDYMKKDSENSFVEWDLKTLTANDYTVEFDISPQLYSEFTDKLKLEWENK